MPFLSSNHSGQGCEAESAFLPPVPHPRAECSDYGRVPGRVRLTRDTGDSSTSQRSAWDL